MPSSYGGWMQTAPARTHTINMGGGGSGGYGGTAQPAQQAGMVPKRGRADAGSGIWDKRAIQQQDRDSIRYQTPDYSLLDRAQELRPQAQPQQAATDFSPLLSMLGNMGSGMGQQAAPTNIQTSITPTEVYTPQQTQQLINQQRASMAQSPEYLLKQYDRPGVSRSDAQLGAIAPQMAAQRAGMAAVGGQTQLADSQTNAQSLLQGQTARDAEFLQLAGLGQQQQAGQQNFQQAQQSQLMQLLMGMI